jgi:hypothetical protein
MERDPNKTDSEPRDENPVPRMLTLTGPKTGARISFALKPDGKGIQPEGEKLFREIIDAGWRMEPCVNPPRPRPAPPDRT